MTDRYGPWQVHTPGECPVPPETMVQVQMRDETQIEAEERVPAPSWDWDWGSGGPTEVAYYRVLQEPEWVRVWANIGQGVELQTLPIRIPVIDGKPDFTRQPKWEGA